MIFTPAQMQEISNMFMAMLRDHHNQYLSIQNRLQAMMAKLVGAEWVKLNPSTNDIVVKFSSEAAKAIKDVNEKLLLTMNLDELEKEADDKDKKPN